MIQRTILEWQSIAYGPGEHQLPEALAGRIAAVARQSSLAGRGEDGVLEYGRAALRARGVVGVLAAEGCTLEILPKIDVPGTTERETNGNIRRRLVHMLSTALDLRIDVGQITALDWQRETLLEILIRLFSEKLAEAVRRGMPRRYLAHADDLPVLRGRLDVTRQFSALAANPSRLACHYDALTPDVALNQIMKAAATKLLRIARNAGNQNRLRELTFAYADIADVPVSALRWTDVVLDRTNSRWRELLSLARLLLGERFQTTSTGGADGFALLFEMNTLFEEYVARSLKRALSGTELQVVSQGGRLYCLETEDGRRVFQTRPDILIKHGPRVIRVVDTKWKRIANRIDDAKQGVSQGDVYQMMAYGQLYDCDRLILLYPQHDALHHGEGRQASHRVRAHNQTLDVTTIDIARTEPVGDRLLRALDLLAAGVTAAGDGSRPVADR